MTATVRKIAMLPQTVEDPRKESVVAFTPRAKSFSRPLLQRLSSIGEKVLPPLVMTAVLLIIWQFAFGAEGSTLPSPLQVWTDANDLIVNPFFDFGSQDIGLGWRVLTSLQRVAVGFGFAAIVGILMGALVGQSVWAMRVLDPIFQVLRTIPPLA